MSDGPDVEGLLLRLAGLGYEAHVECFDRLAVIRLPGNEHFSAGFTSETRVRLTEEAMACGFTHAALELFHPSAR